MKQCLNTFFFGDRVIQSRAVVADDDPAIAAYPENFGDLNLSGPVEQATAAPGEKRTTKRPDPPAEA